MGINISQTIDILKASKVVIKGLVLYYYRGKHIKQKKVLDFITKMFHNRHEAIGPSKIKRSKNMKKLLGYEILFAGSQEEAEKKVQNFLHEGKPFKSIEDMLCQYSSTIAQESMDDQSAWVVMIWTDGDDHDFYTLGSQVQA